MQTIQPSSPKQIRSQKKIEGWKLFQYNLTSGIVKQYPVKEMITIENRQETKKIYYQKEDNSLFIQANNARMATRKIKQFLKHKQNVLQQSKA